MIGGRHLFSFAKESPAYSTHPIAAAAYGPAFPNGRSTICQTQVSTKRTSRGGWEGGGYTP